MRLHGKVALITGGTGGIGRESCLLFAKEGAKIVVVDLNDDAGGKLVQEIESSGGEAIYVRADVSNGEACRQMVAAAEAKFGALHVLFNNAGIMLSDDDDAVNTSEDVWERTMAVNLKGVFLGCKYGIPALQRAGGGSIINVTSHMGLIGTLKPAYAATKGGVISFTKTLAAQYVQYGIRANAIGPGSIRTERQIKRYETAAWEGSAEKPNKAARERKVMHKNYPFSVGNPEHIASIALFLASEDSRMLTGTTIAADGGRSSYLKVMADEE